MYQSMTTLALIRKKATKIATHHRACTESFSIFSLLVTRCPLFRVYRPPGGLKWRVPRSKSCYRSFHPRSKIWLLMERPSHDHVVPEVDSAGHRGAGKGSPPQKPPVNVASPARHPPARTAISAPIQPRRIGETASGP